MTKRQITPLERFSRKLTLWVGTPASLVVHTIFFVVMLSLPLFGVDLAIAMLILTTIVSLEAIYLSLIIQMTVNHHGRRLKELDEDIDDILEDTEALTEKP